MGKGMRVAITAALAVTMIMVAAGTGMASPAAFNETIHAHKVENVFPLEDQPACPLAPGTITAIETVSGHLVADAIDEGDPNNPDDDTPLPPARLGMKLTSHVSYVPDDPSLPSYSGHSGQHFAWNVGADGIGVARVERAIVLKGSDGSRYTVHQVGRAIFDLSQIDSPNEGIVDITTDKISCGT